MIPFLKLPATSKTDVITLRDVFYNDMLRLFVFGVVLLTVFYGVGALMAAAGNNKYPIEYYTQLFFDYTPVVRLIIPLGFCVAVMGLKRDERWWSCLAAAEFMFVVNFSNQTYHFELSGMLSLISAVLLTICAWRLWDYYELRRVYHYDTPQLTRPALGVYITLAIASLLMLIPLSWTSWFWR